MFGPERNPSIEKDEITISAKSTISPMKALRPEANWPETLKAKSRISSRTRKPIRFLIDRNSGMAAVNSR